MPTGGQFLYVGRAFSSDCLNEYAASCTMPSATLGLLGQRFSRPRETNGVAFFFARFRPPIANGATEDLREPSQGRLKLKVLGLADRKAAGRRHVCKNQCRRRNGLSSGI